MKAVNLIPADAKRSGASQGRSLPTGPGAVVLGVLVVLLGLVTVYVLTTNTISDRKAKIAAEQVQLTAAKTQVAKLNDYAQFEQLAQARIQTIREIATSRFDWHAALTNLSKVVPANTSLQSLLGTVSPDASVSGPGGATGASGGTLRNAIAAPAFELKGCTATQDDVARLMSRLRLMDGVTRVTLSNSQKGDASQGGAAVAAASGQNGNVGCGQDKPTFDLVVFFKPLPGQSATSSSATTAASTTAASTAATTTTTPSAIGTPTTSQTTATTSTATTPAPAPTGGS